MNEAVEGQVAAVLNDQELIINIGSDQHVTVGMKFAVLAVTGLPIKDPSSGVVLDIIDREKVRVRVTSVRSKISFCETYEYDIVGGSSLTMMTDLFSPRRKVPKTFRANEYPEPLSQEESYVKIGDVVRELGRPAPTKAIGAFETRRKDPQVVPPTTEELDRLEEIYTILARNGIFPGDRGYDEDSLVEAIADRGWKSEISGSGQVWEARVIEDTPKGSRDSIAYDYWSRDAALAFALAMSVS